MEAEFSSKIESQNRLTMRCYISPLLKIKLKGIADEIFRDLALEDSSGLVLERELVYMQLSEILIQR